MQRYCIRQEAMYLKWEMAPWSKRTLSDRQEAGRGVQVREALDAVRLLQLRGPGARSEAEHRTAHGAPRVLEHDRRVALLVPTRLMK